MFVDTLGKRTAENYNMRNLQCILEMIEKSGIENKRSILPLNEDSQSSEDQHWGGEEMWPSNTHSRDTFLQRYTTIVEQ